MRVALYGIISPHVVIQYSNLWSAFYRTDRKPDNTVWDMYSDVPGGTPTYTYQFVSDQCGTYNSEGDCFNREHSFPVLTAHDFEGTLMRADDPQETSLHRNIFLQGINFARLDWCQLFPA